MLVTSIGFPNPRSTEWVVLNGSLDNIIFPMELEEILQTKEDSLGVANFPNAVRAIDRTLIPIIGTSEDDEQVF